MLKLILDSYKMFFKSFPVILLFAVPLLVLSGISVWVETSETVNQGMLYFYYASYILIPLASIATDISLYRRFFGYSVINPFCSLKAFVLYLFTQLALGLVASAPIILFRHIFLAFGMPDLPAFVAAIALNMFLGIYLLARFSILFPLIIQNKVPALKDFSQYTARPYKEWMSVALLVYMPYVIFNYVIASPIANMLVVNLFAFVFICFNIKYVSAFRVPSAKPATVSNVEVKTGAPVVKEAPKAAPAAEKPTKPAAKKAPTKKAAAPKKAAPAPKSPAAKKTTQKKVVKKEQ